MQIPRNKGCVTAPITKASFLHNIHCKNDYGACMLSLCAKYPCAISLRKTAKTAAGPLTHSRVSDMRIDLGLFRPQIFQPRTKHTFS